MIERPRPTRPTAGRRVLLTEVSAGLAAAAYLLAKDPRERAGGILGCPVKALTGLDCPACGGVRLAHDLLHGRFRSAVKDNPFLLACSPVLGYLLLRHWRAALRGEPFVVERRVAAGLAVGAAGWMVARNLFD